MSTSTIERHDKVLMQTNTFKIGGTSGWTNKQIAFTTAYLDTPLVCVYQAADGKGTNINLPLVQNISTTGFTVSFYDLTVERTLRWQAIGVV